MQVPARKTKESSESKKKKKKNNIERHNTALCRRLDELQILPTSTTYFVLPPYAHSLTCLVSYCGDPRPAYQKLTWTGPSKGQPSNREKTLVSLLFLLFFSFLFSSLLGGIEGERIWGSTTEKYLERADGLSPTTEGKYTMREDTKQGCVWLFFFFSPLGGRALLSYGLRNYSCASLMIRSRPSWQCLTRQCLEIASSKLIFFFYVWLTVCRMM